MKVRGVHRRSLAMPAVMCLFCVSALAQSPEETREHTVLAVGQLEHLFDGGEFTEGPAVAPDGFVYFSDLTFGESQPSYAGHIWRYDPRTGACGTFRSPSNMSNGIEFDLAGRMIVAEGGGSGGGRITRTDMSTGKTGILAGSFGGLQFNSPNDVVVDAQGRIYFTDPRYGDSRTIRQPVMGVYRIDTTAVVARLIEDVPMPNGVALSPDGGTLYVGGFDEGETENPPLRPKHMAVYAYALTRSGTIASRKVLLDFGSRDGPDGMTVDPEGNLYVAVRDETRPGVGVYDPQGSEIGFIALPEIPSNVVFDRPPYAGRLYITAGRGLYRLRIALQKVSPQKSDGKNDE
ncbi:MAG: SMP-30/gluconolactonase/LRE family protein [Bacteroidetes bacterium]|nr:SMP-30/gluconolactonase/LRE family protein [Bacteroidota bacterium]